MVENGNDVMNKKRRSKQWNKESSKEIKKVKSSLYSKWYWCMILYFY